MALNLSNAFARFSPRTKQIAVIALAIGALGTALYVSVDSTEIGPETRWNRNTDKQVSVITDQNNKNLGIDALAGRIKYLDRSNTILQKQIERLERERAAEKTDASKEREWMEKFEALSTEIDKLRAQQQDTTKLISQRKTNGEQSGDITIDDPFQVRDQKRRELLGDELEAELKGGKKGKGGTRSARTGSIAIAVVGETEDEQTEEEATPESADSGSDSVAYIPAGSILTGTLITGADFPTGKGSYDNPTPSLIRISKHAILPNRYTSDVRECFLLVGGRGELSSERAKLRGEMLSCIRNDGSVIQTKLNSYVAGEDGKEGIKGRLVSKQGQLIARTMVAGFLSGMSEAFDYTPVSVLSTTSTGTVQYQNNFSSEAAKSGFAEGLKNSLDRVAEFYMDLADEMVPVVEINAGRQVDIIVISGTTLNVTAKTSKFDLNAVNKTASQGR